MSAHMCVEYAFPMMGVLERGKVERERERTTKTEKRDTCFLSYIFTRMLLWGGVTRTVAELCDNTNQAQG